MRARLRTMVLREPQFWKLNALAWGSLCGLGLSTRFFFYPNIESGLELFVANMAAGLVMSGGLRLAYRSPALSGRSGFKMIAILSIGALVAAFVHATITQELVNRMGWGRPGISPEVVVSMRLRIIWLIYMAWGLGYYGLKAEWAAGRQGYLARLAREEATALELQILRNRLDPHFLFNALNGIAAEIQPHPGNATEMVHEVSDYLRYLLEHQVPHLTSLPEELQAMETYLRIEKARFGEKLVTSIEQDPETLQVRLPDFLLQTLVENAVKHGTRPEQGPLEISIRCGMDGPALRLSVTNTGRLETKRKDGVGLSTLRRRLELHYPERHQLTLENRNGRVCAELTLEGDPCSVS